MWSSIHLQYQLFNKAEHDHTKIITYSVSGHNVDEYIDGP